MLLGRGRPDLVIPDLKMPGMSGPQVLKENHREPGAVPVVVWAAYPKNELVRQALQYGPLTLSAKPQAQGQIGGAVGSTS